MSQALSHQELKPDKGWELNETHLAFAVSTGKNYQHVHLSQTVLKE